MQTFFSLGLFTQFRWAEKKSQVALDHTPFQPCRKAEVTVQRMLEGEEPSLSHKGSSSPCALRLGFGGHAALGGL